MITQRIPWLVAGVPLLFHLAFLTASGEGQSKASKSAADTKVDPRFDKVQHKRWIDFYRREAASYSLYRSPGREKILKLRSNPVLLYTNPVGARGLTHGALFVWTYEGRSEVIGAIWSHANTPRPNQRTVAHEFHSLSAEPLMAVRSGEVVWSTTQAGIRMVAAPEAPQPGSSRAVRLAQMRTLARELTASRHEIKDAKPEELRLLSQPLYRYERPSSAARDGAVFAYCVVWDPEVIVVIESRETERGPRWYYAPARFSHLTLALHHKQKEVWRDTRDGLQHRDPTRGYKLIYGASVQKEVLQ